MGNDSQPRKCKASPVAASIPATDILVKQELIEHRLLALEDCHMLISEEAQLRLFLMTAPSVTIPSLLGEQNAAAQRLDSQPP